MIFTKLEYVFVGVFMGKSDFVWRNTNDGAILAMQALEVMDNCSPEERPDERQSRRPPCNWTWDFRQRMKIQIINNSKHVILGYRQPMIRILFICSHTVVSVRAVVLSHSEAVTGHPQEATMTQDE